MSFPKFQWLPAKPNLEFLRREARTLRKQHKDRVPEICPLIGQLDISLHGLSREEIFEKRFSILDAQRVIARKYSFASWRRLKAFVKNANAPESGWDKELRKEVLRFEAGAETYFEKTNNRKPTCFQPDREFDILSEKADVLAQKVMKRHGWPGPEAVGVDGNLACGLAVAICYNGETHLQGVLKMREALKQGQVYGRQYASISDHFLFLTGSRLAYGMMSDYDGNGEHNYSKRILNFQDVDKRRAKIGLPSFSHERLKLSRYRKENDKEYCREEAEAMWSYHANRGGYSRLDLPDHILHMI